MPHAIERFCGVACCIQPTIEVKISLGIDVESLSKTKLPDHSILAKSNDLGLGFFASIMRSKE